MADFNFRLNRQGPTGKKGEKGEKGKDGNTPIFSEGTNTATEYTLLIDYGDGNIGQTGNLRPPVTNEGGTYVRYNTQTGTYEINEADIADLNRTQGEVTLASVQDVENETALDTDAVSFELRNQDLEDINEDIEALDDRVDGIDDRLSTAQDNISQAQQDIVNLDNRVTTNEGTLEQVQRDITSLQTGKANVVHTHTISQITDAGALAGQNVVDYQSQVINKPTIPTPGNGTITITQGGATKGTFTTNQSSNSTIELDEGGASFTAGTGLELTNQDVLNVKIDGSTITTNADGELVASGGTTLTAGDGITIDQNNEISVNVDNDTIVIDGNLLKANIPDVSNFVTDTQLANTLEAYPTNQALSNLVDYETETIPGQDSWVPLSLSNCRYDNLYDTTTSFRIENYDELVAGLLSKIDPEEVIGSDKTVIGNIAFQNNNRQTAYFKAGNMSFSNNSFLTTFTITGKLEDGTSFSFNKSDIPEDIAYYNNGELSFIEDVYVSSFSATYVFPEYYYDNFTVGIQGVTNELGGYLYNRVQGEPTVVTKAIIADTAVDGTTISVNNDGQLTANIPTPIRKTITQASANISESSGTVTVTDADVTTSTIVTLYPSDTATETWLANNLASNIITEGSGSFTFTVNDTLPATFSMYYIIQEVD